MHDLGEPTERCDVGVGLLAPGVPGAVHLRREAQQVSRAQLVVQARQLLGQLRRVLLCELGERQGRFEAQDGHGALGRRLAHELLEEEAGVGGQGVGDPLAVQRGAVPQSLLVVVGRVGLPVQLGAEPGSAGGGQRPVGVRRLLGGRLGGDAQQDQHDRGEDQERGAGESPGTRRGGEGHVVGVLSRGGRRAASGCGRRCARTRRRPAPRRPGPGHGRTRPSRRASAGRRGPGSPASRCR